MPTMSAGTMFCSEKMLSRIRPTVRSVLEVSKNP